MELIKTTCKRTNYEVGEKPILLPFGCGWKEALIFIAKHIDALTRIRPTILSFLSEWEILPGVSVSRGKCGTRGRQDIVVDYIGEVERKISFGCSIR